MSFEKKFVTGEILQQVAQGVRDKIKGEIVNNLESTDINKPLSANQGKILQDTKLGKNEKHEQTSDTITSMTGYEKAGTGVVLPTDSLNQAIGKLEVKADKALDVANNAVSNDNIVNDLTTGGTDSVLSAEQGKVLKQLISSVSGDGGAGGGLIENAKSFNKIVYNGTLTTNGKDIVVGKTLYNPSLYLDGTRIDASEYELNAKVGQITLKQPYAKYEVSWEVEDQLPNHIRFSYPTLDLLINDESIKSIINIGDVIEIQGSSDADDGGHRLVKCEDSSKLNGVQIGDGKYLNEIPNTRTSEKLDKGSVSIEYDTAEKIENKVKQRLITANTIEQLKTMNSLKEGDVVEVLGYYTAGDGANHKRKIAGEDDGSGVQLNNKLWANIIHNGEVNVSWFGARGDGITDDTIHIQQAINTSRIINGCPNKKYKVGTQNKVYNVLTINKPIELNINLIDNRTFSSVYNNRNNGTVFVNSNDVKLNLKVVNNNILPPDDSNPNNLSDVGGYAVFCKEDCKNLSLNLNVKQINGIKVLGKISDSDIKIYSESVGYPYACMITVNSNVDITCIYSHRAWWGGCLNCNIKIRSRDFVSTGDSFHIIFTTMEDKEGITYTFENSVLDIYDLGTTVYNSGAAYFGFEHNSVHGKKAKLSGTVNIFGDISNTDNSIFNFPIYDGLLAEGNITINNFMKTSNTSNRIYNNINTIFNSYCEFKGTIIIKSDKDLNIKIDGNLSQNGGGVVITKLGNNSNVFIKNIDFIRNDDENYKPTSHGKFIVENVNYIYRIYRYALNKIEKYTDGKPIDTLNTPLMFVRMEQEGVKDDFVKYATEKEAYDNQQEEIARKREEDEINLRNAYEIAKKSPGNENMTYEQFVSMIPNATILALLPEDELLDEPVMSEKLKKFVEKHL